MILELVSLFSILSTKNLVIQLYHALNDFFGVSLTISLDSGQGLKIYIYMSITYHHPNLEGILEETSLLDPSKCQTQIAQIDA